MSKFLNISQDALMSSLDKYNPWWKDGKAPLFPKKRGYFKSFKDLIFNTNIRRTVILMGPRRVGKTVMLQQLIQHAINKKVFSPKNIFFVSIDDPVYNNISLEDLVLLFQKRHKHKTQTKKLIVFDEIQYLKNWERHLKVLTDKYPYIRFIASGSSAAALKRYSLESGAGRFTDFFLPPMAFKEFVDFSRNSPPKSIQKFNEEFVNYIRFGGYPEPVLNKDIQSNIRKFIGEDVISKVLLKDLPNLYGIQDIQELNRLLVTVAFNSGQEINLESLSQNSNIAKNTIQKYLTYLESAFLIRRVYRIDDSSKQFKRARTFKVYLTNPSMYSALFGPIQETDTTFGNIIETAVYSQHFHTEDSFKKIYYARWKKNNQDFEVDLVWTDNRFKPKILLEIKWSDLHSKNTDKLKGLIELAVKNNLSEVFVTSKTKLKDLLPSYKTKGIKVIFIPCSVFCYRIGEMFLEDGGINMETVQSIKKSN